MIQAVKNAWSKVKQFFKVELIEDAKDYWRFWSVRLGWLGIALTSYLVTSADAVLLAWETLPQEIKAVIPPQWMPLIGVVIFVASMIVRGIKQKKLEAERAAKQTAKVDIGIADHE